MKKLLFICLSAFYVFNTEAQNLNTNFCQTNGLVYTVAVDSANNVVYIGGSFSQVCGFSRNKLAAMNLTTGAILPWNPGANGVPLSMYIHRGALYVGGQFTTVGGLAHKYAAKFNSAQYNTAAGLLYSWSPAMTIGNSVNSIVAKNDKVYLGGDFILTVGTGNNLCELDTGSAAATAWSDGYPNAPVNSLSIDGNTLYVGGGFSQIATFSQPYIAKYILSGAGGIYDAAWNPNPDGAVQAVCAVSGRLFIGGGFSFIGADNREKIAEIDVTTGSATLWNPGANSIVYKLGYRSGIVYPVGNFSVIGGKSRNFLGGINVNTGIGANWNGQFGGSVQNIAIAQGQIFTGGSFPTAGGQTRNDFAVFCINPIDTMSTGPSGPTNVCANVTGITYSVSPIVGATSYVWTYSGTGATINGTSNTVTVDFIATSTSGTLSVKGTNGCESTNMMGLPINIYTFTTSVTPVNSFIVCGDSTTINSSNNYIGGGSITYSWSPATALASANNPNTVSGTKITRTYTLTETSTEGCVAKDMATITVNPYNLNATSATSSILCSTKDSLHVTNNYTGFGTVTYTWAPAASVSLPNGANTNASPVVNTDYTVTSSATDGCVASAQTVFVTVNPISLLTGSTSGNITCGDVTQLNASNNYPGAGTLTYTWSPATALSNANITNPIANPITTTSYTLTLNSPEGCVSTDQTTIILNALQVNTAGTMSTTCHGPVNLNTTANSTNTGLTYLWSPSTGLNNATIANPIAVVGGNTTYNVTMSLPSSGCANASSSVNIVLTAPSTPQICMVTVDSASTHNIVYWDKAGFANASIDSFRIYREISTNTYGIVGAVHYNSLSEFHDFSANPNVTTYRYKISALDSCGLESPLSLYHNTIYILYSGSGQYNWNPGYTIEPTTNPVNNYLLMRDDNNVGIWNQVASTSGSQNTIVDPAWASFPNANWQVVTSWAISCTPTARQPNGTQSAIVKSKSNITNNRVTGIKKTEQNFSVYPNPTSGNFTIAFANAASGKTTVKITSVLGQDVYNETFVQSNENHNIDLSKYENGIYLLQITTNNTTVVKRIVKN